jgi:hypothetical protein
MGIDEVVRWVNASRASGQAADMYVHSHDLASANLRQRAGWL